MAAIRPSALFARLERFRVGPFRPGAFPAGLHDERTAAVLGIALGVSFTICFATGLVSHGVQRGPAWWREAWPADPVSLYRFTQGLHIFSGIVAIPLLLVKLWVVFPRLFAWPPFRDLTHLIERTALVALVAGSLFQLATGVMNIFYWYAFPFNFPNAHYAGAWIAIGGLVTHIGAKWSVARRALRDHRLRRRDDLDGRRPDPAVAARGHRRRRGGAAGDHAGLRDRPALAPRHPRPAAGRNGAARCAGQPRRDSRDPRRRPVG